MEAIRTAEPPALDWNAPVTSLPGVGPKRADSLRNLGITTIGDLLRHFPRAYLDRRASTPIGELEPGTTATVVAEIVEARARRFRRNASMCVATLSDGAGTLKATWFGRGFLASQMTPGKWLLLTGDVIRHGGIAMRNPDYRLYESRTEAEAQLGGLEPVYPLTDGVSQRVLRTWMRTALDRAAPPQEIVPETVRTKRGLLSAAASVSAAHFPTDALEAQRALEAGAYTEALALQTAVLQARRERPNAGIRHRTDGPLVRALPDRLTYGLTRAQRRCVTEVLRDMAADRPMARLLQGDVGAGKTCVALHAAAAALDGGYQVALMAPTEVLAYQHHATFADAFAPLNIECALLTGTSEDAHVTRKNTARGIARVVVGTHALFQDATQFAQLGLVIVDEQHRFGVHQRDRLVQKGSAPDVLHMTATPLPRSLALTLYGRMDLSIIDRLPPGRVPVKTRVIPADKESGLWEFLRGEAQRGAQAYVVCPMLEDTEKNGRASVEISYRMLSRGHLRDIPLGLLHGRMDSSAKLSAIEAFRNGQTSVLVSTTVVEVGVDVKSASTMVIVDAHRFGLTQLHQLRGRVGRGTEQAYCFLLGEAPNDEARERLDLLCRTNDGFELAEADLRYRGPGELHGVRQSGFSESRLVALLSNIAAIQSARHDAEFLLTTDSELAAPEHAPLAREAARYASLIL